jgi:hypothetical protein
VTDTSLQIGYREDAMAICAFVKPCCVLIRKIDSNSFQPAFLPVINGLFNIFSPIFDLPEKWLTRMPHNQRPLPGP